MKDMYDKQFLFDTLFLISKEIEELSSWSVYNHDVCLDEIADLKTKSDEVRRKLIDLDKQGELQEENL